MSYENEKREIISWGAQLYGKGLVCGKSGNISLRVNNDKILITAHDAYLGLLEREDILLMDMGGQVMEGKKAITSEKKIHLEVHKNFPEKKVIIHAHSPHTVYFFHFFQTLESVSFEERFYLGKVSSIPQYTPTVTDVTPVIEALKTNNIVVLKDHGVVATGEDFKSAFSLIELLETQARLNLLTHSIMPRPEIDFIQKEVSKKYKLFSKDHISCLVDLVNSDEVAQSLGKKFNLTTILGIKELEGKEVFNFYYDHGKIIKLTKNEEENAEFIISGKRDVWEKIFNREIDPFVASTQGIIKIKGDFNKLSQWFPVFERTFKLWGKCLWSK